MGVVKDNDCAFKVKSANGAYVMQAANSSDAKSWARAIDVSCFIRLLELILSQISIRVAKARKASGDSNK